MQAPTQLENYRLEPAEWVGDMYAYGLAKPLGRFIVFIGIVLGALTFLFPSDLLYFLLCGGGGFPLLLFIRWSRFRDFTKNPLNRNAWISRLAEFDEMTFRVASSDGTRTEVPFRNFVVADETKKYILLFLTGAHIMAVPKAAFKTPEDEAAFRNILNQNGLLKTGKK